MVGSIDTDALVTQLMAVERKPQDLLKTRITTLQTKQNAWQAIADKLTALKTASDSMTGLDALAALRTVSSSDTSAITVRSTGSAPTTSASIEVIALAAAQSVLVSDVFTSATDAAGGRSLDLTSATGVTQTFASADGTIGGLATAINSAGIGVSARVLQTAPGQYQLALSATTSGTAAAFTAGGTGWGSFDVQRVAANAQLKVDGITLSRSTNVINDAIDGVELSLQKITTTPVVVTSARDDTTIVAKVKALVDAANALGTMIDAATKISPDVASRGPLAGDYGARSLMTSVRDAIAAPLASASGAGLTASSLGVSLNRDGTINFDSAALIATLSTQPADALAALGRSVGSTATGVSVSGTLSTAVASNRTISVSAAASRAGLVGVPTPLPAAGTSVSMQVITPDSTSTVTFTVASTWSQTAGNLNAAMRAAGVKVSAVPQTVAGVDQGLNLTSDRYGSTQTFTISGAAALGIDGTATSGTDAAGTIDGVAFVGNGQSVTSGGMVLTVATTAAQLASLGGSSSGTITLTQGLAGLLSIIGNAGSATGSALASKATLADQVTDLQKRVDAWDQTLIDRESSMRTKFTAMQVALDKLNAMSSSIAGLVNSTTSSG